MKKFHLLVPAVLCALVSCVRNTGENCTVVISLDAFRHDYPEIHNTPNLLEFGGGGVRARMAPSYPASTFPNHYTMATGLVPDHNGIVNTSFWDSDDSVRFSMGDSLTRNNPKYYLGETVWNTAERQGVRTATLYWAGSDIPGMPHPSIYRDWYDTPRLDYDGRADEVVRLLSLPEDERPRLIMTYFDEPDGAGHRFGPNAEATGTMVEYMDSLMGAMVRDIRALPHGDRVNIIITSDHGMAEISDDRRIDPEEFIKPEWVERIIWGNPTGIYPAKDCCDSIVEAFRGVPHVRACRKADVPAHLQYGSSDRLGDVILIPDLGWTLSGRSVNKCGNHGYDPEDSEMQVIFFAAGPDFKKGLDLRPAGCAVRDDGSEAIGDANFRNVDLYPLLCRLLGIKPEKTDGSLARIRPVLR